MKICVIGMGYIGFPTACAMASAGHEVVGVDINERLIYDLSNMKIHISNEPGLKELAEWVIVKGSLRFSTRPEYADAFVVCVPTPVTGNELPNGIDTLGKSGTWPSADLSFVKAATEGIVPYVRPGNLIVLESTVPPGTTEHLVGGTLAANGIEPHTVYIAHAPERVLPGAILKEIKENDRVIGGVTHEAAVMAKELYSTFVTGNILITDAITAEMSKLMENTYRDVNIALANEFAIISDKLGINVQEAIALANRHPRVNILAPGPGVGGHCIPVDPNFIISLAPECSRLIQTARMVNRNMPHYVASVVDELAQAYGVLHVAILGTAYKADVADFRESPSFEIAGELKRRGYAIRLHDPYHGELNGPIERVCEGVDLILLATDHTVYKTLSPDSVARYVSKKILLDTRLTMPHKIWEKAGFVVRRLGDGRHRVAKSFLL